MLCRYTLINSIVSDHLSKDDKVPMDENLLPHWPDRVRFFCDELDFADAIVSLGGKPDKIHLQGCSESWQLRHVVGVSPIATPRIMKSLWKKA